MTNGVWRGRRLPELLLGLAALAVAVIITGIVIANAIRDVKLRRDTITVTGSARQPITADLAKWSLAVNAEAVRPQDAVRLLKTRVKAVRSFLRDGGLTGVEINEPPVITEQISLRVAPRTRVPAFRVIQRFRISSEQMDKVESVAAQATNLLAEGIPVSTGGLAYISTKLTDARIEALTKAIADAHRRAETIVRGIGDKLGSVRRAELGVYQVTPRNSTEISDYGINDTTTRQKDVTAVVTVTFAVR